MVHVSPRSDAVTGEASWRTAFVCVTLHFAIAALVDYWYAMFFVFGLMFSNLKEDRAVENAIKVGLDPQDNPEQLVQEGESTPWSYAVQCQRLLTER